MNVVILVMVWFYRQILKPVFIDTKSHLITTPIIGCLDLYYYSNMGRFVFKGTCTIILPQEFSRRTKKEEEYHEPEGACFRFIFISL